MEELKRAHESELAELKEQLKREKEKEVRETREKYEKIIEDLKKNSMSDREFIQKEMQRRIEELEKTVVDQKAYYDDLVASLEKKLADMRSDYER
mmetsp:Transcript_15258/g.11094  ORF Transcript_15258/g.11094 Transcript_15258/m.11094 type:complete len:95 (+) Transcript_15258:1847-2131(+)